MTGREHRLGARSPGAICTLWARPRPHGFSVIFFLMGGPRNVNPKMILHYNETVLDITGLRTVMLRRCHVPRDSPALTGFRHPLEGVVFTR